MTKDKRHPASCPCPDCLKVIEQANKVSELSEPPTNDSRLRKLTPEQAKVLGYIPADSR